MGGRCRVWEGAVRRAVRGRLMGLPYGATLWGHLIGLQYGAPVSDCHTGLPHGVAFWPRPSGRCHAGLPIFRP
ncbi:hypothetical protein DM50_3699 [Burkholderia mallei]|nr:hypothetical protein DM50_3699 [Burkholderia mallei]